MSQTEYIVENRAGVACAIKAAAQPTFLLARDNPFVVRVADLPNYSLTFREGITTRRAEKLAAAVNKLPKGAFQ